MELKERDMRFVERRVFGRPLPDGAADEEREGGIGAQTVCGMEVMIGVGRSAG